MRKHIALPAIAAAGGVIGLGLRHWELATAFEANTGLPIPGAPATLALWGWTAVVILALVLLGRTASDRRSFDEIFAAGGNAVYLTACVLAAFLLLLSGGLELLAQLGPGQLPPSTRFTSLLKPLLAGLSILSFFSVLVVAKNQFRTAGRGKECLALLPPCLLFCVWLISEYQLRAADPILLNYGYSIFAILAAMLGLYYLAAYSFQTGKPRRTVFFCLFGVYLSLVTMADRHTLSELLRYGFVVLFLTAHTVLLLREHSAGEVPTETEDHHA